MPAFVTGHSSGEIAAAYAAGLIPYRTAMTVAYLRGQAAAQLIREQTNAGAMLALGIGPDEASKLLERSETGYATIAAINSRRSVTVSGDAAAIESIQLMAEAQGVFARRLNVQLAYHSRHMDKIASSYSESLAPLYHTENEPINVRDFRAVFASSVTGRVESSGTVNASYWIQNLLQPVRFAHAIEAVFSKYNDGNLREKASLVIEVGPHSALKAPINQILEDLRQEEAPQQAQPTYVASLMRDTPAVQSLLNMAGTLFNLGVPINLRAINQTDNKNARVLSDLPRYAWDKSVRYVHKSRTLQDRLHPGKPYHPLLGWKCPYEGGDEHTFRQVFTLDDIPWIRDHHVAGHVIWPFTGYIALATEALRKVSPKRPSAILLRDLYAKRSLEIEEDERIEILTKLRPAVVGTGESSSTRWSFEILSWSEARGWIKHCYG